MSATDPVPTPAIPVLTPGALREELAAIHREPRRSLDTAFYGAGEPGEVAVSVGGREARYRVVPVRSELALRRALARRDDDRPLVLLVDYDTELPRDLTARLARGRLFWIDEGRRLQSRFQAKDVKADVRRDRALVRALLDDATADFPAVTMTAIASSCSSTCCRRTSCSARGGGSGSGGGARSCTGGATSWSCTRSSTRRSS